MMRQETEYLPADILLTVLPVLCLRHLQQDSPDIAALLLYAAGMRLILGKMRLRCGRAAPQLTALLLTDAAVYPLACLSAGHMLPVLPVLRLTVSSTALCICVHSAAAILHRPERLCRSAVTAASSPLPEPDFTAAAGSGVRDGLLICCGLPADLRTALLRDAALRGTPVLAEPELSDLLLQNAGVQISGECPLLLMRAGLSRPQRIVKRLTDIVIASVLLVLLSPLMLLCAAAVRAEDGGSAVFRQRRLTENGRVFEILKLRSMTPDGSAVTRTGRILRRYRLDELPQLVNVLRGEMSLVGPRPELPELTAAYESACTGFTLRLLAPAGLTGLAQVCGRYDTAPADKLRLDLMYIGQYSLLLDFQIMLMTLRTVLFPDAAYGSGMYERSRAHDHFKEPRRADSCGRSG